MNCVLPNKQDVAIFYENFVLEKYLKQKIKNIRLFICMWSKNNLFFLNYVWYNYPMILGEFGIAVFLKKDTLCGTTIDIQSWLLFIGLTKRANEENIFGGTRLTNLSVELNRSSRGILCHCVSKIQMSTLFLEST